MALTTKNLKANLTFATEAGIGGRVYAEVVRLREAFGDDSTECSFDAYSRHYLVRHAGEPIGCLTATRPRDGQIDCHAFYPASLIDRYRDSLMSLCRLRITRTELSGFYVLRHLFRTAWHDQLDRGVRLDLINVHRPRVRGYQRIGYVLVPDSDFVHPTLGTDSVAMMLPADPTRKSFYLDLFGTLPNPRTLTEVTRFLEET